MSKAILLDTGPLGLATNPKGGQDTFACNLWMRNKVRQGTEIVISEIADYEVRRELIRANKLRGLRKLNEFKIEFSYLPLSATTMLFAAELWAHSRQRGFPTASDDALDADVILAAQALLLEQAGHQVIVASTNVKHLKNFVTALNWSDIT